MLGSFLAEGVGFEPTRRGKPPTRFPGVRTRPDYAIPPGFWDCRSDMDESHWTETMRMALAEAAAAADHGDVPVGAVLVDETGRVVAADHNRREQRSDPTAHAELLVLQSAARDLGDWRLAGCTLVVTLEPCAMCAMAAVWSRVDRIVYGAPDPKAGAAWSLYNIPQDERLNHRCELEAGVLSEECAEILESFFRERRS